MNTWFIQCAIKEAYALLSNDTKDNKEKVIFGGKKNFIKRCKNLITREIFLKYKKLHPIYSIGTCNPYKGNRFFRITDDLEHI